MKEVLCARCGFQVDKSQSLESKHTNQYYCLDFTGCDRRLAKNFSFAEIVEECDRILEMIKDMG